MISHNSSGRWEETGKDSAEEWNPKFDKITYKSHTGNERELWEEELAIMKMWGISLKVWSGVPIRVAKDHVKQPIDWAMEYKTWSKSGEDYNVSIYKHSPSQEIHLRGCEDRFRKPHKPSPWSERRCPESLGEGQWQCHNAPAWSIWIELLANVRALRLVLVCNWAGKRRGSAHCHCHRWLQLQNCWARGLLGTRGSLP